MCHYFTVKLFPGPSEEIDMHKHKQRWRQTRIVRCYTEQLICMWTSKTVAVKCGKTQREHAWVRVVVEFRFLSRKTFKRTVPPNATLQTIFLKVLSKAPFYRMLGWSHCNDVTSERNKYPLCSLWSFKKTISDYMFTLAGSYPLQCSHNTHQWDEKRAWMKRLRHVRPLVGRRARWIKVN